MYKLFLFSRKAGKFGEKHVIIQNLKAELQKSEQACAWSAEIRLEQDKLYYVQTTDEWSVVQITKAFKKQVEAEAFSKDAPTGVIYLCGGDGSVHEVTNLLVGSAVGFAVLPTGSGNDFSRNFYTKAQDFSLANCLKAQPERLDILSTSWEHCVNVLSLAYDVAITVMANLFKEKYAFLGGYSYYLAVLRALFLEKSYDMAFELEVVSETGIERQCFEKKVTLVALCNGAFYGNGFVPSPHSQVQDGVAELCVVDALTLPEFFSLIGRYKKGTHLNHPKVHMYAVKSGKISYTPAQIEKMKAKNQEALAEGEGITFPCEQLDFKLLEKALWHFRLP